MSFGILKQCNTFCNLQNTICKSSN